MKINYKNYTTIINGGLAIRQKVTEEQKVSLAFLYERLNKLFKQAQSMDPDVDSPRLKLLAEQVKTIEFQLQRNWNFPEDERFHNYCFVIPHCQCPVLDNRERMGTDMKIITANCPVHGINNYE